MIMGKIGVCVSECMCVCIYVHILAHVLEELYVFVCMSVLYISTCVRLRKAVCMCA